MAAVAVTLWEVWATRSIVQALWAAAGCPQGGTFHSAATDHTDWKEYQKGNLPMSKSERRPRLTAARKFELYLATRSPEARWEKSCANTECIWMTYAPSSKP